MLVFPCHEPGLDKADGGLVVCVVMQEWHKGPEDRHDPLHVALGCHLVDGVPQVARDPVPVRVVVRTEPEESEAGLLRRLPLA